MKDQVTGVIIIHNDASLLEYALNSAKPYIDRLLIVDGAYEWVAPFCKLHGEDPEKSTDNLLEILDNFGLPYEYYFGVWENETHKRTFSLEKVQTDFIMRIDSDEIYEIDRAKLNDFYNSNKVFANCFVPLYFSKNIIGISTGLGTPPVVPIFINKAAATVKEIVDSMFLLVPDDERTQRLPNSAGYTEKIGIVHHLSSFRHNLGSYRRSRFYILLSMRVSKKLAMIDNSSFSTDEEFYEKIESLSDKDMAALDNLFFYHRINAAFPAIKENQKLVKNLDLPQNVEEAIVNAIDLCLSESYTNFMERFGVPQKIFSNKTMFIDMTKYLKENTPELKVHFDENVDLDIKINFLQDIERTVENVTCLKDSESEWTIRFPAIPESTQRCVVEVFPRSRAKVIEITFS